MFMSALHEQMAEGGLCVLRTEFKVKPPVVNPWEGPVTTIEGKQGLHFYQAGEPSEIT